MAQHKLGFFTASTIGPLLTGKGDKLLAGGIEYAKKIALERLNIINEESIFKGNDATEWGNMYEAEAIQEYEKRYFTEVKNTQKEIEKGLLSCTPDGYIGDDQLIEVKCPFCPINHYRNLFEDGLTDYFNQAQFQLMLSNRSVCNLVSYDPRFPKAHKLGVYGVKANKEWQDRCMNRIEQAESIIATVMNDLKI